MGPVGIGWGVRVGYLAGTGTPGPEPHPTQSCPEQHKTGFECKEGKEHSSGVLSLSLHALALSAPPHTWRCPLPGGCGVLMEAPWQGIRELLGQVF